MKYKIIRIIGVLMLVFGAALIILQLAAKEKSVVGSIAAGATPIIMGTLVLAVSFAAERRAKASGAPSDTQKPFIRGRRLIDVAGAKV